MTRILEIIGEGFEVMLLGLGTVFVALIGLILVVNMMKRAVNRKPKQTQERAASADPAETVPVAPEELPEGTAGLPEEDAEELIAVITAAAAVSLNRSTHTLVVRSVRSIPAAAPLWNRAGRSEQISSRL
jgi:sodium pump decarboxylase gamma subunit